MYLPLISDCDSFFFEQAHPIFSIFSIFLVSFYLNEAFLIDSLWFYTEKVNGAFYAEAEFRNLELPRYISMRFKSRYLKIYEPEVQIKKTGVQWFEVIGHYEK